MARGIEFRVIDVENDFDKMNEMVERSKRRTVPQILFGDRHIGGHDDLVRYYSNRAA